MSINPNDFLKMFTDKGFYLAITSLLTGAIGGRVFTIEWIRGYPLQSSYINIAFWFIFSFLLLSFFFYLFKKINEIINKRDKFIKLDHKSKEILNFYLDQDFPVACLNENNGIVVKMEKDGLIYKSGKGPTGKGRYDYNINSDVFEYLKKHRKLIRKRHPLTTR